MTKQPGKGLPKVSYHNPNGADYYDNWRQGEVKGRFLQEDVYQRLCQYFTNYLICCERDWSEHYKEHIVTASHELLSILTGENK